jgi:flagellar basal-body rod protein FlgB
MKLFDTTIKRLESSLDIRLEKQNVLNGNLANIDTPGYLPREFDFDKALAAAERPALQRAPVGSSVPAREDHLPLTAAGPLPEAQGGAGVEISRTATGGLDGNGVDLDKTMVELSRNALLYGAAAKSAGKKLAILRYVATDGVG